MQKGNASKLVTAALLGKDSETITVAGREYVIYPPTIKRIVGAGYYMSDFGNEESIGDMIREMSQMEKVVKALSWFIEGDETLTEELMQGTLSEITEGLETAIQLIDVRNFIRLSSLAKNVGMMIAKQR